jgi:hypothetical protein
VLIQLFPPDDERLSLETCRGGKINTLKKEKSASSWLKIHNCLRMHGQQNIKFCLSTVHGQKNINSNSQHVH